MRVEIELEWVGPDGETTHTATVTPDFDSFRTVRAFERFFGTAWEGFLFAPLTSHWAWLGHYQLIREDHPDVPLRFESPQAHEKLKAAYCWVDALRTCRRHFADAGDTEGGADADPPDSSPTGEDPPPAGEQ